MENKRTILFLIPWMVMGGADKFNLDLIKYFSKIGWRIIVCTTEHSNNEWQDLLNSYTDEVYHLPSFLSIKKQPRFLLQLIESNKVDIVFISHSRLGYFVLPWLKEKSKQPFIAVDYLHLEEKYWYGGGFVRFSA